jgi:hypothetical protein
MFKIKNEKYAHYLNYKRKKTLKKTNNLNKNSTLMNNKSIRDKRDKRSF